MATNPDSAITLSIIDKLHATIFEVGRALNRNILNQIVLSIAMFAFTAGIAQLDKNQPISIMTLDISYAQALFAGMVLISLSIVYQWGLLYYEHCITEQIQELYMKLGYKHKDGEDFDPVAFIGFPDMFSVILSVPFVRSIEFLGVFEKIVMTIILLLAFMLAPAAELTAFQKMLQITGTSKWLLFSSSGIMVITFIFALLAFMKILIDAFMQALVKAISKAFEGAQGKIIGEKFAEKFAEKFGEALARRRKEKEAQKCNDTGKQKEEK